MSVVSSLYELFLCFRFSDVWMIQNVMNAHRVVSTLCQANEAFDNFNFTSGFTFRVI